MPFPPRTAACIFGSGNPTPAMRGRVLLELPSLVPPSSIFQGPCEDNGPTWPDSPGSSPHLGIFNGITSAQSLLSCQVTYSQVAGIPVWTSLETLVSYHTAPSLPPTSGEETAGIFSASFLHLPAPHLPSPNTQLRKEAAYPGLTRKRSHPNPYVDGKMCPYQGWDRAQWPA